MNRRAILIILFLVTVFSAFSQPSDLKIETCENDPIEVKSFTLKNGLRVFLTENHDSPKIFGAVVVKAGGKTDPAYATGMAHYLEHMLFKGTTTMGTINYEKEKPYLDSIINLYEELAATKDEKERALIQKKINRISVRAAEYAIPNEMDRMLSEIGGEDVNAFTDLEMTVYHNEFPASQVKPWLDIYAHRFQNPVFRLFQSELETVYEEKNIGMDNPMENLFEKFMENFYKVHPYGQQTIIGKTEHLKNPSLKTMYEYFEKYYVPNNMALVLSGDFNSEEIIPLIEEKFSQWKSKPVDDFPVYTEKEFKGREKVKIRSTPLKVGACGYRAPSNKNPDHLKVEIITNMLSNGNGGFIDELSDQGKIMMAGMYYDALNDYGHAVLYFIPKVFGQPLKKAEKLVYAQVKRIQDGDFTDEYLMAVKNNMLLDWETMKEYNESRALEIASVFASGKEWRNYLDERNTLKQISKTDIMEAAKKYFGENYLSMYSKMGFTKKDKLPKPDFEPVIPKEEIHSDYYNEWKKIESDEKASRFVDFEKDVTETEITTGVTMISSVNPFNSVFSLKIKFGTGKYYDDNLKILPYYLNIADSYNSSAEFKRELYALGCTIDFTVNDYQFIISLEGLEDNMEEALKKTYKFLSEIKSDDSKIKKIVSDMKAEQRLNDRSAQWKSQALNAYVNFNKESFYLTELSPSEIARVKADEILESLKETFKYKVKITFAGKANAKEVSAKIKSSFPFQSELREAMQRVFRVRELPEENTVYLLNDKKARQSQIHFFMDGKSFSTEQLPVAFTFNKYFGGDMSSLVFQEIRELRSLAYSTYGSYNTAYLPGNKNHFNAYVGCQADKSIDAISAMMDLIHKMPEKRERMEGIKSSMMEEAKSSRPGFRNLPNAVEAWKERGFTKDANQTLLEAYQTMTFDQILEFYKNEIQNKTTIITIVGDKSKFDLKELEKFGKVVEVKLDQITKK